MKAEDLTWSPTVTLSKDNEFVPSFSLAFLSNKKLYCPFVTHLDPKFARRLFFQLMKIFRK